MAPFTVTAIDDMGEVDVLDDDNRVVRSGRKVIAHVEVHPDPLPDSVLRGMAAGFILQWPRRYPTVDARDVAAAVGRHAEIIDWLPDPDTPAGLVTMVVDG